MKALLLAGTVEARQLAEQAQENRAVELVASFAGHTRTPRALPCETRTGGFGGVDGLARYLREGSFDVVVDATHPFAAQMHRHALDAAREAGIEHARLVRPPWTATSDDHWVDAADLGDAARIVREVGVPRVLLTVGRLDLAAFAGLEPTEFVVRSVEDPGPLPFAAVAALRARGPFTLGEERAVIDRYGVGLLVTKNSGGHDAKLASARAKGIPVVMIRRPAAVTDRSFADARDACAWLASLAS